MTRFVEAVLLPENLTTVINPVRASFEPKAEQIIPPHVTVLFPFNKEVDADKIALILKSVFEKMPSFEAEIGEIGYFDKENGGKVAYLQVHPTEKFLALFQASMQALGSLVNFDLSVYPGGVMPKYLPHITFAMNTNIREVKSKNEEVKNLNGKKFFVDKVFLLRKEDGEEMWTAERMFKLM